MVVLDMLGKPCPIPVVQAKKELAKQEVTQVQVIVDNIVAVQNLEKMANGLGYTFLQEELQNKTFSVVLGKTQNGESFTQPATQQTEILDCAIMPAYPQNEGTVLLFTKDYFGEGSRELGQILIKGFIFSLGEWEQPPSALVFLNGGVNLLKNGSNVVEDLSSLAEKGVKILGCGTCLNYYQLSDQIAIGEVVDMFAISTVLKDSSKVITI